MNLYVRKNKLSGSIAVPGSKSHTIRVLAFAMMADGVSVIHAPLISGDTLSALNAAKLFGAEIERGDDSVWTVKGTGGALRDPGCAVNMENSGTSIKLFAALASLTPFELTFDGDESLRSRPMGALLSAMQRMGVRTASRNGKCPFSIRGPLRGGRTVVNGKSSQYVSAMLIACPAAEKDSDIDVVEVNEQPYIGITLGWLDKLGIRYEAAPDYTHFHIPGGQKYHPFEITVPADFSTAAFPLVAAAVTGSPLEIRNLDFGDTQGDKAVFDYLRKMGVRIETNGNSTRIFPADVLRGTELDLNATPDALPAIAVAAACARGTTVISNVAQARIKETDRIACMAAELTKMGVGVAERPDGLVITGGGIHSAVVKSYGDHRIAMALAVAGLAAEGETVVTGAECAAVTYPSFLRDFNALNANFRDDTFLAKG